MGGLERHAQLPQGRFGLRLLDTRDRAAEPARSFLETRYHDHFGSAVRVLYPRLLVLADPRGGVAAAVGIRRAAEGALFLEQYLHARVEEALSAVCGRPVERQGIVELGSFAATSARTAVYLIAAMAAFMQQAGYEHALVTSTDQLRRLFGLFAFDLRCLGDASKDALADGGACWGDYYDHAPRVLAGSVPQCLSAVRICRDQDAGGERARVMDEVMAKARALATW